MYKINSAKLNEITALFNEVCCDDMTADELDDILGYTRKGDKFRAWADSVDAQAIVNHMTSAWFSTMSDGKLAG